MNNSPEYLKWCSESYKGIREQFYNASGVTTDEMVVALWEKFMENRPEAADALQQKRLAIKQQFPKSDGTP